MAAQPRAASCPASTRSDRERRQERLADIRGRYGEVAATTGPENQFFWTLAYWTLEGRPSAMDPDGDGVPCVAFFEPGIVASVLAGGPVAPRTAPAAPATMSPDKLAPGDVLVTSDVGVAVVRDGRVAGTATAFPGLAPGTRYRLFGTAWVPVEGELVGAETALVGGLH